MVVAQSSSPSSVTAHPRVVGRYALYDEIASGGMATVHIGRLLGPVGFSRTVAIKRLHPQYAKESEFVSMFLDEARLAARIRHPNVVGTLDVVATDSEAPGGEITAHASFDCQWEGHSSTGVDRSPQR